MSATAKSTRPPPSAEPASAPTRRRKRLRKEEIVAEATRLFAERGYEGASMGDLADRVGLRKASLFHHFPSKDVLYAVVLEQLLDGVRDAIAAAATSDGSFEGRLDALSDALTATFGSQPHTARLLVREAMDWGPVMRDRLGRSINDVLDAARYLLEAGQRDGAFNPELDPAQTIVTLVGIHLMPFAIGEVIERFVGSSPFDAASLDARRLAVREHVRLLVLAPSRRKK